MNAAKFASCALACLTAFGSARAATSSVQVDHLRVQLIDLDTSDGITPAFTVFSSMTTVRVFETYIQVGTWSSPVGPYAVGNPDVYSNAAALGGDIFSAAGWSATASSGSHVIGRGGDATVHLEIGFTLTPHTMLVATTDAPLLQAAEDQYEGTFTSADLTLWRPGALSRAFVSLPDQPTAPSPFQASFSNVAGSATYGYLDLRLVSHTFTVGPPVPEPQTAALLMAGLALMGVAVRRRR